jgi:hypothetical protein
MKRQIMQIAAVLLVVEAAVIGAYLIWGVKRTGELTIISNPPGARVLLNLEPTTFMTDTVITDLREGNYSVTLEKKGYVADPFVQVVHMQRNRMSAVSFDLKPAPAPTAYIPPPAKQEQKVRPEYQPTFPMPEGALTKTDATELLLSDESKKEDTPKTAEKQPRTSTSKATQTSLDFGSLDVNSNITGADIYMDGKPTGQKTNATLMIPLGIHRFAVTKENYIAQPEEVITNVTGAESGQFVMFELTEDLESVPYKIKVTTEPISGGILVDDMYRGQDSVELEVEPGEYLVSFQAVEGYETPRSMKVTLTPNKRQATVKGTYERRLELSMFLDSLGVARKTGQVQMDLGYYIPAEGFTPDTLWGPAIKYVKSLDNYAWELGWGIATRNPTGNDYIRFRFDVPEGFARTKPVNLLLYVFGSSKNYPLTVLNKAEVDLTVNGEAVWEDHKPENNIDKSPLDSYEELSLDPYIKDGTNEIVLKAADGSQCFVYLRGIEIR